MPKRSSKPKDHQQLARAVLDAVVPDAEAAGKKKRAKAKNPAAVALGKLGGKKGGPARAKALSAERKAEIAKKAAQARWAAKSKS